MTEIVKSKFEEVSENIAKFRECVEQETEPECKVRDQCFNAYECGYWGHCAVNMPDDGEPTVWGISRLRNKQWNYKTYLLKSNLKK